MRQGDRVRVKATGESAIVLVVTDCSQSVDVTVLITNSGQVRSLDASEVEQWWGG